MKTYKLIAAFAFVACALISMNASAQNSAGKTSQKLLADVVGTWKLGTHSESGTAIKAQQSHAGETLEFTQEAKFISRKGSERLDSGYYRMNENQKKIYLESAETHVPVEWNVRLKNNTLTLYKNGDEAKTDLHYIYLCEAVKPKSKSL